MYYNVSTYPAIVAGLKKFPDAMYSRRLAPFTSESGNVLSILNHVDDAVIDDDTLNVYVSGYVKVRLRVGNAVMYESKPVVYKDNLLSGVFGDIFHSYKQVQAVNSVLPRRVREVIELCDGIMCAMKEAAAAWMSSDALIGEFDAMQIATGNDFRLTMNDVIDAGSYRKMNYMAPTAKKTTTVETAVCECVGSYIFQHANDDAAARYFPRMRDNIDVYIE